MKKFYTDSEIRKMHETGDYPDTDMSDEAMDDSDADPNYQEESATSDSDDWLVPVRAPISKLHQKKEKITRQSLSPQPSTSRARSLSPSPQAKRRKVTGRSPSPQPSTSRAVSRSPSPESYTSASQNSPSAAQPANDQFAWSDPIGNQKVFQFTGSSGLDHDVSGILALADPIDYFLLFLTPQVLNKMVNETNLYATQILEQADVGPRSRLHDWTPTDYQEMTKFIGLLGWMGLVKVPKLADYWRRSELYAFPLPRNTMSRNKFELLLRFWHFANNDEAQPHNRLRKIEDIVQMFVNSFQSSYTPGQKICVDETMIPWRGRLSFRQYIPSKRHRYGVKLYKLCTDKGYTWNLSIYVGNDKGNDPNTSASQNVVMKLIRGLLDEGRTLYIDNFYTSVPLARELLTHNTHVVGTLRQNRKYIPQEIKSAQLRKGEIIARESNEGITILKWKDKRDVMMLTTTHLGTDTQIVTSKIGRETVKPVCVIDYDSGKSSVDVSDQLSSYNTSLRRSIKWYRKVLIEILWGTSLVNAYFLYCENSVHSTKLTITQFRESVIQSLLNSNEAVALDNKKKIHHLVEHGQKKEVGAMNAIKNLESMVTLWMAKKSWQTK